MMPSVSALIVRYPLFAVAASASNLATQSVTLSLYNGFGKLTVSILCGTAIGFGVKYILDKRFIFFDRRASSAREIAKIIFYGLTAVVTTVIFWSFELSFWAVWSTPLAKYTGAVIGLGIGYVVKYALDRRFVFIEAET